MRVWPILEQSYSAQANILAQESSDAIQSGCTGDASVQHQIGRDVRRAIEALAANSLWRDMLAENILWASCESLLQTTLLWSFNALSGRFVADRERTLAKGWRPDLVVLRRAAHDDWHNARQKNRGRTETFRKLACGVVQLKVAWTEGNAYGSASLPNKVVAIRDDLDRLHNEADSFQPDERYVGVLLSGVHPQEDGPKMMGEARRFLHSRLLTNHVSFQRSVQLLLGHRPAHWRSLPLGADAAFSELLFMRVT